MGITSGLASCVVFSYFMIVLRDNAISELSEHIVGLTVAFTAESPLLSFHHNNISLHMEKQRIIYLYFIYFSSHPNSTIFLQLKTLGLTSNRYLHPSFLEHQEIFPLAGGHLERNL
ncbi:hypothetical protein NPIL_486971 [Nephila pilipes]|uniref:Uncharacterized protein n=1 Tax=Nephila pilipes TaxID=299642 RepID=A0A8X6P9Y3_NEPPI|nr:hypothetical protein NPIL_486971 [Nephila pilipes]